MAKNISLALLFICLSTIALPTYSMNISSHDYLLACEKGDLSVVQRYIRNGSNINCAHKDKYNPCQIAARGGQLEILKYLVEQKCDEGMSKAPTPFHIAAQYGHLNIVKWYVNRNFDVNLPDHTFGTSPLHAASIHKNALDVLVFLLNTNNINVNQPAKQGFYPVNFATESGNIKGLQLLLDKGANLYTIYGGMTLLHSAAKFNRLEIVKFLVKEKNISLESQTIDPHRFTPLHMAAQHGATEVGMWLKSKGANVEALTAYNESAFALACRYGKLNFAKTFLPYSDVNAYVGTCYRRTALYEAAKNGYFEIVKFLMDNGADDTLEASFSGANNQPTTVEGIAQKYHRVDIVDYLKQARLSKSIAQELLDTESEAAVQKANQQKVDSTTGKKKKKKKISGVAVPAKPQRNIPEIIDEHGHDSDQALIRITIDKKKEEFIDFASLRNDRFKQTSIFLYKNKTTGLFTEHPEDKNILIPFSQPIDNIGSSIAKNFLLNADYSPHVETKENLHTDYYHNFTRTIDQKYGHWARIIVDDFNYYPSKKAYWAQQLGTENVEGFWFALRISIPARIHKDKYPEEKARRLGPTGIIEYVVLAENFTESGKRVVVHRWYRHD